MPKTICWRASTSLKCACWSRARYDHHFANAGLCLDDFRRGTPVWGQPVLSNLIAGIQLAITQPIRLEDAVTVQNEYGWVEEITSTYVVIRLWDLRRLIVPINFFIQQPFYNWTRRASSPRPALPV
jgi:hypothetical protein